MHFEWVWKRSPWMKTGPQHSCWHYRWPAAQPVWKPAHIQVTSGHIPARKGHLNHRTQGNGKDEIYNRMAHTHTHTTIVQPQKLGCYDYLTYLKLFSLLLLASILRHGRTNSPEAGATFRNYVYFFVGQTLVLELSVLIKSHLQKFL